MHDLRGTHLTMLSITGWAFTLSRLALATIQQRLCAFTPIGPVRRTRARRPPFPRYRRACSMERAENRLGPTWVQIALRWRYVRHALQP
jgi:hypothetical protein